MMMAVLAGALTIFVQAQSIEEADQKYICESGEPMETSIIRNPLTDLDRALNSILVGVPPEIEVLPERPVFYGPRFVLAEGWQPAFKRAMELLANNDVSRDEILSKVYSSFSPCLVAGGEENALWTIARLANLDRWAGIEAAKTIGQVAQNHRADAEIQSEAFYALMMVALGEGSDLSFQPANDAIADLETQGFDHNAPRVEAMAELYALYDTTPKEMPFFNRPGNQKLREAIAKNIAYIAYREIVRYHEPSTDMLEGAKQFLIKNNSMKFFTKYVNEHSWAGTHPENKKKNERFFADFQKKS